MTTPRSRPRLCWFITLLVCIGLGGCFDFGATRFYEDQLGYSQALGNAENSETLLNVVRLRYAEAPRMLQATQVIAGYQLQSNVTGGFEFFPAANPSTFLTANGSAQLQQQPTFTFQPLSGEQFADIFIRPLSPAELLSVTITGTPIDLLFQLAVQSINGLNNARWVMQMGASGLIFNKQSWSPEFFRLLQDLRRLQIAGLLGVRIQHKPGLPPGSHDKTEPDRVYLSIATTRDPDLIATADEAKRLLGMTHGGSEAEVVFGRSPEPGKVTVLTRPLLHVLAELAIQVDVPPDDIARHRTLPTVSNIGLEHRSLVIIHSGVAAPADVFASVRYRRTWFWIADDDFESKLTFGVVQLLLALARTTTGAPGVILAVPTRG